MSVLAPLYFLGALAVGLPVLFHLIRRRPKGEIEFSSLMFLQPTPPRLTKRSRLENWPLLLLRAMALILLAAAFARPFLRSAAFSDSEDSGRRLMLVMDTSASMQRAGLWDQAKEKAKEIIDDIGEGDQLSIVAFDKEPRTLLSYDQAAKLTPEQLRKTANGVLRNTSPTWHTTNLGAAISYAADLAVTYEPDDAADKEDVIEPEKPQLAANMILVSDMQQGSQMESLQRYTWPKELRLDIRHVTTAEKTNASAQILGETHAGKEGQKVRVRVSNDADSLSSRFRVAWVGGGGTELPAQVPKGESRVLRMPLPSPEVTALVLRDDDHSFDNQRYLVSPQPEDLTLMYVGSEASEKSQISDQRESLLFYLQRLPLNNVRRSVTVVPIEPNKLTVVPEVKTTPLIVVGEPLSSDTASNLRKYASAGGKVLFVMSRESDANMIPAIETITGASGLKASEAKTKDYAMFSQIDFGHPLFQPMSDPQFNDFTKVRFWTHRELHDVPDDWTTVVQFDDDVPAIVECPVDQGLVWVMTTGWQPNSSQLALSTKFLPLMFSFFETLGGQANQYGSIILGDPLPYAPSPTATLRRPDGTQASFANAADADQVDMPGIYTFADEDRERRFAVNLPTTESQTKPMGDDALQRFGIQVGKTLTVAQTQANQRQLRDIELEKKQKLWQWLLLAALVILAIETLWGGLISRGSEQVATN